RDAGDSIRQIAGLGDDGARRISDPGQAARRVVVEGGDVGDAVEGPLLASQPIQLVVRRVVVAAAVGGDQGGDIVAVGLIRLGDVVIGTSGVGDSLEAAQAVVVIVGPAHGSGVGSAGDLTDGIAQVSQRHGVAGDQAQLAGPLAGEVLPRVVFVAPVPCRQRSGDGLEVPDGRVAVLPQLV